MKYNFVALGVPAAEKSVNDVAVSVNVLGIGGAYFRSCTLSLAESGVAC